MATVTRKFRDDFDLWAADRLASGAFTPDEIDGFKAMLRRDLEPGPDRLRQGLAAIHDHEARYQLWADYFATEATVILAWPLRQCRYEAGTAT